MRTCRLLLSAVTTLFLVTVLSVSLAAQGSVSVTPDGGTASATANTTGNEVSFTVMNTASEEEYGQYFSLGCSRSGSVSSCSVSPDEVYLDAWEQTTVTATYATGSAGSGTVTVDAWGMDYGGYNSGYYTVTVTGGGGPPPTYWDTLPYNYDNQDMSRCAAGCFAATHSFSTVPYISLDTPRNVTLVYNGDRVDPQPFIHLNVQKPSGTNPNEIWLQVKKKEGNWEYFTNNTTIAKASVLGSGWQRIGAQLRDTKTWTTGMYDIVISVAWMSGTDVLEEDSWDTKLMVVNENNSPIARGWTVAGVQRLYVHGDSALITEGDGSAKYFRRSGSSFQSPTGEFSKLWMNGSSGWKRTYPDSTEVFFNTSGYMTDIYDRFNNRTQFVYSSGRLTQINDPDGDHLYFYYLSSPYRLYYIRNSSNYSGSSYAYVYSYFSVNSTTRTMDWARDPDYKYTYFYYDGSSRLNKIKDRRGDSTLVAYSSTYGRLASVTAEPVPVFGQGSVSPVTEFTAWQQFGVPSGTSPLAAVPAANVKGEIEEPGGATTTFTVNRWGQPVSTTNALNQTTTITYHAALALPFTVTHPNGGIDSTWYNSNGTLSRLRPAGSERTDIQYHSTWVTLPTQITGTNQPTQTFGVSAGTTTWSQVGPSDSLRVYYYYDSIGRNYKTTDDQGTWLNYNYYEGINGNRSKQVLPGGGDRTFGYDNLGRQKWTRRNALPKDSVTYDSMNRVTHAYDEEGNVTVFTYDNLYLIKVKDPKNQEYEFAYNALGWLTGREDPQNRSDTYQYSIDGDLMRWTNRQSQNTDYEYDDLHRMDVYKYKRGSTTITNTYTYYTSSSSSWVRASDPYATDTTFVNYRGQPDRIVTLLAGKTFTRYYNYLAGGLLDSIRTTTSSGPSFVNRKYTYDMSVGNLSSIKLHGYSSDIDYNKRRNPIEVTLPGNDRVNRSFTLYQAVSQVASDASYGEDIWRGMEYDGAMRIYRHIIDDGGVLRARKYSYDDVWRVVGDSTQRWEGNTCVVDEVDGYLCEDGSWVSTADYRAQYVYDDVGNRTDNGGTYATGNRITAFDDCTYTTDYDGNVLTRSSCPTGTPNARFHWTSDNMLMAVKLTSTGDSLEFYYDAAGRLTRKKFCYPDGMFMVCTDSYFLWDGENLFAELDASGNKVAEYSYNGLDDLHAVVVGTQPYFAHKDGLGNVIALTDRWKNVKRFYEYDDIWGLETYSSSDTLPSPCVDCDRARFKNALYLGEEADIHYMRSRWYEPHTGRFLSEDPIGLEGGMNLYTYAANDPVNLRDPFGQRYCEADEQPVELWFARYIDGILVYSELLYVSCYEGTGGSAPSTHDGVCTLSTPFGDRWVGGWVADQAHAFLRLLELYGFQGSFNDGWRSHAMQIHRWLRYGDKAGMPSTVDVSLDDSSHRGGGSLDIGGTGMQPDLASWAAGVTGWRRSITDESWHFAPSTHPYGNYSSLPAAIQAMDNAVAAQGYRIPACELGPQG